MTAASELCEQKASYESQIQHFKNSVEQVKQPQQPPPSKVLPFNPPSSKPIPTSQPKPAAVIEQPKVEVKPAPASANIVKAEKININEKEKTFLVENIGKQFDTVLKYRGTRDGFTYEAFHRKADGVKPSITLFTMKSGMVIGGFTSA